MVKPGHGQIPTDDSTSKPGVALQNQHFLASSREISRSHQAVVPGTHRNDIESFSHRRCSPACTSQLPCSVPVYGESSWPMTHIRKG